MGEFEDISEKYYQAGVSTNNIEYAVTSVRFGSNPRHILENLKVGYDGLNDELANAFLHELFIANAHETKRKKRIFFAWGMFYSIVGFVCCYYMFHVLIFGGILHRPAFVFFGGFAGIIIGFFHFSKFLKANESALIPERPIRE